MPSLPGDRQVATQAGLVPSREQSGSSVRGKAHLSKRGNAHLRKGLYWPAITAMSKIARFREFAQRQRNQGKKGLVIISAIMRKLVELAYAILRKGLEWGPVNEKRPHFWGPVGTRWCRGAESDCRHCDFQSDRLASKASTGCFGAQKKPIPRAFSSIPSAG